MSGARSPLIDAVITTPGTAGFGPTGPIAVASITGLRGPVVSRSFPRTTAGTMNG
ncbi:hypothetical protein SHJG_0397 [Streptomyces hygroscopicus subsp. jinggangensis 5008]|nr:hypothetical protein SHJG_0397 [Streptomyces hygroscopicus subsp. jinggangensis 5008]AGF59897.1 hypothetical protein SHJGH_0231 [Streptomyces hygroscopicus subsp. jinggangensis TL01]